MKSVYSDVEVPCSNEDRVIGNISPILGLMTPGIDKCALMLIEGIREYVSHKKYLHRIGEEADKHATRIVADWPHPLAGATLPGMAGWRGRQPLS